MKVLICSPEEHHRHNLSLMLTREGMLVTTCATHNQATSWVMADPPDVILIDPWQDGSVEHINQVMNVFWHYNVRVAFITNRVNEDELKLLVHPQPDLVINLLTSIKRTVLPELIRKLAHQKAVAR